MTPEQLDLIIQYIDATVRILRDEAVLDRDSWNNEKAASTILSKLYEITTQEPDNGQKEERNNHHNAHQ